MGVMNLTPDSFSDGGCIHGVEQAVHRAGLLLAQGADVLDLGSQSTRPGAEAVGPQRELERLLPALELIRAAYPQATLSVDTFHAEVAEAALAAGADWVNDVHGASGLRDPAMAALVAHWACPYVLMHSRGDSGSMDGLAVYGDVVVEVRAGQLVWDPGLGFAKTTAHNLELLSRLPELAAGGYPLLLGPSRKRFIGAVLHEPRARARLWGTAAVCAQAIAAGGDVLRVHDVGPIVQVARMADALRPIST